MRNIVKLAVATILLASPAIAENPPRQITVTGEGSVSVMPDLAMLNIGVSHRAKTAEEAVAMIAEDMTSVMAKLASIGVAETDIETTDVSLNPFYEEQEQTYDGDREHREPPKLLGYVSRVAVNVRLKEIDRTGAIIDLVVEDGANTIGGLWFRTSDPARATNEARRQAVADGRARAELYAEAAGVTLGRLVSLSEEDGYFEQPIVIQDMVEGGGATTIPITPNEISSRASVVMVYEITD
jgi:uncharacterized protein YggE